MKKIYILSLVLLSVFCAGSFAFAQTMTDAQRQALINQIQQKLNQLTQQAVQLITQQQGGVNWCYTFNSNMGYAQSGTSDVTELHIALLKQGLSYAPDDITTYSNGTSQALIAFQQKYGILQTGYFGNLTRSEMNSLYGCSSSNQNSQTNTNSNCITDYQQKCYGNYVYWYDSCGNKQNLIQTCSSNQTCNNGACVTTSNTNSNCVTNYQQKCYGNAVYEFDSCGNVGNLVQTCLSSQSCNNGSCTGSSTSSSNSCLAACPLAVNGTTYAVDCSGYVTACSSGQTCKLTYNNSATYNPTTGVISPTSTLTGAQCTTSSSNCTQNYQQECYGNSVYEYDSCNNIGSLVQACLASQTCSNGSCTGSSNGNSNSSITLIHIVPAIVSLTTGSTQQLTATDQNGSSLSTNNLIWSSDNVNVASVDANGIIHGGSTTGTVNVTASVNGTTGLVTSNPVAVTVVYSGPAPTVSLKDTSDCATPSNEVIWYYAGTQTGTIPNKIGVTLAWTSTNATSCTLSSMLPNFNWNGTVGTSGSINLYFYASNWSDIHNTYSITCTNPGGSTMDSTWIDFRTPPPPGATDLSSPDYLPKNVYHASVSCGNE